jgi:hypothetical protein
MRVTISGKAVQLPPGATVADAKCAAGVPQNDTLLHLDGSAVRGVNDGTTLKPNARYRSIPLTKQGQNPC